VLIEISVNGQRTDDQTAYQKTYCLRRGFFDGGGQKKIKWRKWWRCWKWKLTIVVFLRIKRSGTISKV